MHEHTPLSRLLIRAKKWPQKHAKSVSDAFLSETVCFLKGKYIKKVFERRMRKVYWLSVTFPIWVKSGEERRRREYDKMRQRNVTYP